MATNSPDEKAMALPWAAARTSRDGRDEHHTTLRRLHTEARRRAHQALKATYRLTLRPSLFCPLSRSERGDESKTDGP
jgi:hypothetical protein